MNVFEYWGLDEGWFIIGIMGVILILLILIIIQFRKYSKLREKYDKMMKGADGESLESNITKRFGEIDSLKEKTEVLESRTDKLTEGLTSAYQKAAILKYDAFKEMGGKLSFSLAVLNCSNDGFILTSMHSSAGGCYTYIKEIIKGESFILLSEEEKQVLQDAISKSNFLE